MSYSSTEARTLEAPPPVATRFFSFASAIVLLAFLLLWLEAINQLQREWSFNPQYAYGWTVPFLAAWIFFQRWRFRPSPEPARFPRLTILLATLAGLILFPARLVAVANPDWRLLSWTMSLAVVTISLGALYLAGGAPWLRHFAFPVLFFLVATPWPVQLEQVVVQNLMRADTAITIQILNLLGTVALQHGNVIELSTGQVGIDDACTGVRSLQATFMIALFLGEFYRMKFSRRLLLVVIGAALAFLCNIGRTLILCEIAANNSVDAIHQWHDPAGYTILFICLFLLWGLSLWLKPSLGNDVLPVRSRAMFRPTPLAAILIAWICLTEISVAAWYRTRDSATPGGITWTVVWPTGELDYQPAPIPPAAAALLQYNEGGAASWRSADDRHWLLYSFHWLPGRTAALFVKTHRPDVCLPASGMTMEEQSPPAFVRLNDVDLPVRAYRFNDNGRPLHIFYCYWDGRSTDANSEDAASENWTAQGRLRAAWQGKREVGARMLELAVWGYDDDREADAALRRELTKIIRHS